MLDDEFQLRNGELTKFVTSNIYLYSFFCWVSYFQKKNHDDFIKMYKNEIIEYFYEIKLVQYLQFNETILYLFKKHNNLIIGLSIAQNINIYIKKYYMLKIITLFNKYNKKKITKTFKIYIICLTLIIKNKFKLITI